MENGHFSLYHPIIVSGDDELKENDDDGSQKYLVGIIVLVFLLITSLVILGYFIYQIRRLKSCNENVENMTDDTPSAAGNYRQLTTTHVANKTPGQDEVSNEGNVTEINSNLRLSNAQSIDNYVTA